MRTRTSEVPVEAVRQLFGSILACVVFYALFLLPRLGTIGAALFLGAGVLYAVIAREKLFRAFGSAALVMLLPVVAIVSTIWSVAPSETLRASVQYAATAGIMIVFFRTLPLRRLVGALMLAGAAATLTIMVLQPDAVLGRYALDGGLGSKNIAAFNSSTTILAALGVVFDRMQPKLLRIIAAPTIPMAILALILAQSAGALVSTTVAVLVLAILVSFKNLPLGLRGGAFLFILAVAPIAWFMGPALADAVFADVLSATGKDTTLTGRTELWNFALSRIPDNPIFGRGYQAFWIQGTPDAEGLWRMGNIRVRSGFSFHNQYLEILIELGAIGFTAFVITAISGFIGIMHKALVYSNNSVNCLAVLLLSLLARSSVESVLAVPFSTFTALFMAACCVGITSLVESGERREDGMFPASARRLTASPFARRGPPSGRPT